jgi:4-hydroxy-tetrahydrodipicolinate synthase
MDRNTDFSGLTVALATPFSKNDDLDLPAFRRVVRHVVDGGADNVVVLGSTGEAATITEVERDLLITACIEEANATQRRARVIVGTGHNATRQAATWTRRARDLGADGALVVTPYYNKPMPAGIVAHFAAVAEAAPDLPIVAYNVPGRTGLNLTPKTLETLWKNPSVVALKESSGNLAQIGEIARTLPPNKQLLAGDDNYAMATIALGGVGLVSVIGNVLPAETAELVAASRRGDLQTARAIHHRLLPLMDALFLESNPIPTKAALSILGLCENVVRLPLTPAEESTKRRLSELLGKSAR